MNFCISGCGSGCIVFFANSLHNTHTAIFSFELRSSGIEIEANRDSRYYAKLVRDCRGTNILMDLLLTSVSGGGGGGVLE
jgi:hypothetical protein